MLDASAGWEMMDFRQVEEVRRGGYPAADYFGAYAVEDGEVLSMVRVLRLPFTTPRGVEQIAAIQRVITRRDRARRGLASKLLKEVHRRERAAGGKFALLWTSRGMVAHSFYESLGYSDVYTPEFAVSKCVATSTKAEGYELKRIRVDDISLMEKFHAAATTGRLGFTPRSPGIVPSLLKLRILRPESLRLILHHREPSGYAVFQKDRGWSRLDELVVPDATESEVLPLFESEAAGGWLTIRGTIVRDSLSVLRRRHYRITRSSYSGLLALDLDGRRFADVSRLLGTMSRLFTCQGLDHF